MSQRVLIVFLLVVGCKASSIRLPKPNATTAFIAASSYPTGKLLSVDLSTRVSSEVLPAAVFSGDTLIRSFEHQLYLVARDSFE